MATSPLFGWQEPDDTSLVKDGAAAIRTLGNAIDTSMGDLLGGTTGQVLAKASNTNMDFTWVAQDDSNAIQNAIVDAKGDLIAATAADTPARLAVGADNNFLQAASGQTTGLQWGGAYTTYTPVVNQNGAVATSSAQGRYIRIGKFVTGSVLVAISGTGNASQRINISLPFQAQTSNVLIGAGNGSLYDASSFVVYPLLVTCLDATNFNLTIPTSNVTNGSQYLGVTNFTAALASGDEIGFRFFYEVA